MVNRKGGRRRLGEPPQMRHFAPRNLAYVSIEGKRVYLGRWGSPEARLAFRRIIAQWEQDHREQPYRPSGPLVTVADLVAAHSDHAKVYYRRRDGTATDEVKAFRTCLAPLVVRYAALAVDDVQKSHLRELVQGWIAAGLSRATINKMLGRVKRVFRWGSREDLVSEETADRLENVAPLPRGRSQAPEPAKVQPVPWWPLLRAFCNLSERLQLAVLVQLRTGARPGEVCAMHASEIHEREVHIGGDVLRVPEGLWAWAPTQHKTEWRGKAVVYLIGPRLQAILKPYLKGYLFPGRYRDYIREDYYSRMVAEACEGVEPWSPNRLRHNFLTRRKRAGGWEAARQSVMHTTISTTQIYVQRDLDGAADLARFD